MNEYFNTKVKKYFDGTTNTTFCSKPIFTNSSKCKDEDFVSSDIDERLNAPPTWEEVEAELQRDRENRDKKIKKRKGK